jgi:hypothetical protein
MQDRLEGRVQSHTHVGEKPGRCWSFLPASATGWDLASAAVPVQVPGWRGHHCRGRPISPSLSLYQGIVAKPLPCLSLVWRRLTEVPRTPVRRASIASVRDGRTAPRRRAPVAFRWMAPVAPRYVARAGLGHRDYRGERAGQDDTFDSSCLDAILRMLRVPWTVPSVSRAASASGPGSWRTKLQMDNLSAFSCMGIGSLDLVVFPMRGLVPPGVVFRSWHCW